MLLVVIKTLALSSSNIDNLSGVITWLETTKLPEVALIKPFQVSPIFNATLPPVKLTVAPVAIVVTTFWLIKLSVSIVNLPLETFNSPALALNNPFEFNSEKFITPEFSITSPNQLLSLALKLTSPPEITNFAVSAIDKATSFLINAVSTIFNTSPWMFKAPSLANITPFEDALYSSE